MSTPPTSSRLKRWLIAAIVVVVLGCGVAVFGNAYFKLVRFENALSEQYKTNQLYLGDCIRNTKDLAGIANAQSSTYANAYIDVIKGRYQGTDADPKVGQGGAWFSALAEKYPGDLSTVNVAFDRLAEQMLDCRAKYTGHQVALRAAFRDYDDYTKASWTGLLTLGQAPTDNLVANNGRGKEKTGQAAYDDMISLVITEAASSSYDEGIIQEGELGNLNGSQPSVAPSAPAPVPTTSRN